MIVTANFRYCYPIAMVILTDRARAGNATIMNDPKTRSPGVSAGWDSYWKGIGRTGAYSTGGVKHPAIQAFWSGFFHDVGTDYPAPRILDIASGDGAVLERALEVFGEAGASFTCLDASEAAIDNIRERFPQVRGVIADARMVPLETAAWDVITSQFGVEYAGPDALNEAARLLADGGRLGLLLHNQAGSIFLECKNSVDAIERLRASKFIPAALELFRAGFPASRGADRAPYEAAAKQLAPAVQALESIMEEYGQHVAGDTVLQLYTGVDRIHRNMQRHDPDEVLDWLRQLDDSLASFSERMSSMCACAIDDATFERICAGFRQQGYALVRAEPLAAPDDDLPLAWILIAEKGVRKFVPSSADDGREVRGEAESPKAGGDEKLKIWTRQQLEAAVKTLTGRQLFSGFLVEAKPAWVLPFQILIGKVREKGQTKTYDWLICGEVPTDLVNAQAAKTPREAARYFALKWQRDAALGADLPSGPAATTPAVSRDRNAPASLAEQAEALYELVEDPRVWPQNTAE